MVGVPRSKGCQTCISRRTKCDEARPACGNCIRYGSVCPGYDRGLKFVAGKHTVRPRGKPPLQPQPHPKQLPTSTASVVYARLRHSAVGAASLSSSAQEPIVVDDGVGIQDCKGARAGRRPATALEKVQSALTERLTVLYAPQPLTMPYVGVLLETLQATSPHDESLASATWIGDVSIRLEKSKVLEISVCAFTRHLLGKLHQDEHVIAQSRTLYGSSLRLLQQSLSHPQRWKSPETLGASLILCLYELFAGTTTPNSWMQHAKGVARLIQLRGPNAHREDWERAMLLSFRPVIIMNALFSGEDCFLAKDSWQAVIKHSSNVPSRTISGNLMSPDSLHVGDIYFQLLAKLPSIVRHAWTLREANMRGMPVDIQKALLLTNAAQHIHSQFLAWHPSLLKLEPTPREGPSTDLASIFPSVLRYANPWYGALHMGYWASMLILQETMIQCRYPEDFSETNKEFTLNILRSLEDVGQGMMGAYRCGYSTRIAFEFADDKQKAWIVLWLGRFEKTYAATSAKTYPGVPGTSPVS